MAIFVHFGNCLDELNRKDIWNPYNADIQKKALQSEMTNEVGANEDIKDKEAFFRLFNMILWSQSDDDSQERRYGYNGLGGFNPYLQQGLLRRPMPVMFKRQDQLSGSMYRSFVDSCYGLACQLGLGGMFSSIERMFSR